MITKQEVLDVQEKWANGLLKIVETHQSNKEFTTETSDFIDDVYAYDWGEVLFKPTLASDSQFRKDKEGALSYFIGLNPKYSEDKGFALKGWQKVRWENAGIQLLDDVAIAMGNYYFTNSDGELKVEFTFVFRKDNTGKIKIVLHDSHLPYQK